VDLRKLLQLSARETWLLAQAAVLLPTVRLALRFITVAQAQSVVERALRPQRPRQISPQAIARMVHIAAHRGLYRCKCLDQSLVLGWLLRRQGIDARIVFGARKEDNQMEAHAWVEVEGVAIGEDDGEHQRFLPIEQQGASINI